MTNPVKVNAWERHPSVDFRGTSISQSILFDPRGFTSNPEGCADALHAAAADVVTGKSWRHEQDARF